MRPDRRHGRSVRMEGPVHVISFAEKARHEARLSGKGRPMRPTGDMVVLCRASSVVRVSDIVKRKRIRLSDDGRQTTDDGRLPSSVLWS
jgi:hypothetical protein